VHKDSEIWLILEHGCHRRIRVVMLISLIIIVIHKYLYHSIEKYKSTITLNQFRKIVIKIKIIVNIYKLVCIGVNQSKV